MNNCYPKRLQLYRKCTYEGDHNKYRIRFGTGFTIQGIFSILEGVRMKASVSTSGRCIMRTPAFRAPKLKQTDKSEKGVPIMNLNAIMIARVRMVHEFEICNSPLQEIFPSSVLSLLDNTFHFLRTRTGCNEQTVRHIDDDKVIDTQT